MAEMDAILNSIPSTEQKLDEITAESGKDSYLQLVPAVDQSIRLLFALADTVGGEASLTQLTKEVGISKSKGLAILNTLRNAGLVTRNDRSKNYRLGPNLLVLSQAFTNTTDLAQAAAPYLEELAAETGCNTHLGIISGETLFVAARRYPRGGTYVAVDVGHRYPLTWGAHGRAYLATLSPEELETRLGRSSLLQAGLTDREGIDRDVLLAQVEESRRLGYGVSIGNTWSGLNAVSAALTVGAPEFPGGRRTAGFIITVGSFPTERVHEIGERTVATANQMSDKLGPLLRSVNLQHFELTR
jgi:DNA-binding IclR family transcriptional regulator